MRTLFAAAAVAASLGTWALGTWALGTWALAQDAETEATTEGDVGGAAGLATTAAADTFFVRAPLEYHLLATELPGRPVFLDASDTGMQRRTAGETDRSGAGADSAILEGEAPLGAITDLLVDRRGGTAGLVLELTPEMRGGGREIAVAMGLVRMLPDPEDPATTHILISLDPVDLESAPTFERSEVPEGPGAATAGEPAASGAEDDGGADVPQQGAAEAPQDGRVTETEQEQAPAAAPQEGAGEGGGAEPQPQ